VSNLKDFALTVQMVEDESRGGHVHLPMNLDS